MRVTRGGRARGLDRPGRRCRGTDPQHLSPAEKKAGWTLLFDGKSLDGWRAYKRPDAAARAGWSRTA